MLRAAWHCMAVKSLHSCSDVCVCVSRVTSQPLIVGSTGFRGGKGPGRPTMFWCLTVCTTCACHLLIFISEENLFVDAIKLLSVVQTTVFHLYTI